MALRWWEERALPVLASRDASRVRQELLPGLVLCMSSGRSPQSKSMEYDLAQSQGHPLQPAQEGGGGGVRSAPTKLMGCVVMVEWEKGDSAGKGVG